MMKDEKDGPDKDGNHINGQEDEEGKEVAIISPSDAIVDPGTVVVKCLDAGITVGTVRTAGRTIELTGDTPLHSDISTINYNSLIEWSSEVVINVFVRRCCRVGVSRMMS